MGPLYYYNILSTCDNNSALIISKKVFAYTNGYDFGLGDEKISETIFHYNPVKSLETQIPNSFTHKEKEYGNEIYMIAEGTTWEDFIVKYKPYIQTYLSKEDTSVLSIRIYLLDKYAEKSQELRALFLTSQLMPTQSDQNYLKEIGVKLIDNSYLQCNHHSTDCELRTFR